MLLCSRQKDSEALNAPQSKPVAILTESENINTKWDFADHQVQKKKKKSRSELRKLSAYTGR